MAENFTNENDLRQKWRGGLRKSESTRHTFKSDSHKRPPKVSGGDWIMGLCTPWIHPLLLSAAECAVEVGLGGRSLGQTSKGVLLFSAPPFSR